MFIKYYSMCKFKNNETYLCYFIFPLHVKKFTSIWFIQALVKIIELPPQEIGRLICCKYGW